MNPIETPPYTKLASIYDGMMEHVEYKQWSRYIDAVFKNFGVDIKTVCETACGTGTHAVALAQQGYEVTCADISNAMIEIAKGKSGPWIKAFHVSSMTEIDLKEKFDAVLCLYDSVNYLLTEDDIQKMFSCSFRLLNSGGLFIFDACSIQNSMRNFKDYYEHDKNWNYKRRSHFDKESRIQRNEIGIVLGEESYHETHDQRIYTLEEWREMISKTDFNSLAIFEDMSFDPASEKSDRFHFILEKP